MATQASSSELKTPSNSERIESGAKVNDEISLLELLTVIAEQKRVAFRASTLFAIVSVIASFLLPRWRIATATLLPPQQNSSLNAAMVSQLVNLRELASLAVGGLGLKNLNHIYVGMLKGAELKTGLIPLDSQARVLIESASILTAQIGAKETEISSLRTFATDENARLIQTQQKRNSMHSQLAKLGGSEGSNDASLLVAKGRIPEAGLEYVRILRNIKCTETLFEIRPAIRCGQAQRGQARRILIKVADRAQAPDKRTFPQRTLVCLEPQFSDSSSVFRQC